MQKTRLTNYLVLVSVATLVAAFFTVVDKSYSNLVETTRKTVSTVPPGKALTTKLDTSFFDQLKSSSNYEVGQINEILPTPTPTVPNFLSTPTPTVIRKPSP